MMGLLAGLLSAFSGPLTRYLVLGLGSLLAITGGHLLIENWKGNLVARGERQCDARWEARIRAEAAAAANADVQAARQLLETERQVTGELHDRITAMHDELERVRAGAAGGDERCLSDSVLDSLGAANPPRNPEPAAPPTPSRPAAYLQELFQGATGGAAKGGKR